jgi:uncharacterized protein YjbI with pentapeptide repeats
VAEPPASKRATPISPPRVEEERRDVEPEDGLVLREARLVQLGWTGATLRDLDLRDVVIEGGELSGVTLEGATFERVRFVRCRMAGLVAPALRASHVVFDDCRLDDAWLRAATLERVGFEGCSMPRADLYAARIRQSRLVRCDLTELELSQAELDDVAFHGSRITGLKGGAALRNAVIGSDQVYEFAGPILHAANVRMDDDYLRPPDDLLSG